MSGSISDSGAHRFEEIVTKKNVPVLDLHGERTEGLEDKVDRFLMQANQKGLSQVKIMTGKGSGKVLAAVQAYLKLGGFHFSFDKNPNGSRNEGVLVIHL